MFNSRLRKYLQKRHAQLPTEKRTLSNVDQNLELYSLEQIRVPPHPIQEF